MSTDESHFRDVRRRMSQIPGWVNWKTQLFPLLRSVCAGCMPLADWGWQSTIVVVFHSSSPTQKEAFPFGCVELKNEKKRKEMDPCLPGGDGPGVLAISVLHPPLLSFQEKLENEAMMLWVIPLVKTRKACVGKKIISKRLGFKTVVSRGWITNAPLPKIAALPLWGQSCELVAEKGIQDTCRGAGWVFNLQFPVNITSSRGCD